MQVDHPDYQQQLQQQQQQPPIGFQNLHAYSNQQVTQLAILFSFDLLPFSRLPLALSQFSQYSITIT